MYKMAQRKEFILLTLLAGYNFVSALPFPSRDDQAETSSLEKKLLENPVQQLENLKTTEAKSANQAEGQGSVRMEVHRLAEEVKDNGDVVFRVAQQGEASSRSGQPPRVHVATELLVPTEGVHKTLVQDGAKVTVHDHQDAHKEKVFRGAARLVKPSSVAADTPPAPAAPAHTPTNNGNRRSVGADTSNEINNNKDRSSYDGVVFCPRVMAEYVFWTGDERRVAAAVLGYLQVGAMTNDDAIEYLQEVKCNVKYLAAHYAEQTKLLDAAQKERVMNRLLEQTAQKESFRRLVESPLLEDAVQPSNKHHELVNSLLPLRLLPFTADSSADPVKRSANDPMLSTNIINTSDYDREAGPLVTEEEYEDMMERLRAPDTLYTQNSLAEVIYQLAKMMFAQTLSRDRDPAQSRSAMQRFLGFLEAEVERGQLSRNAEKTVLDVMIAALSDTVAEHPDLVPPREGHPPATPNRSISRMLETGAADSRLSRALLAAYKDEVAKGHIMQ